MGNNILNILTFDIEDYFMVSAFNKIVDFHKWNQFECRVVCNTTKILNILNKYNVKATFFIVGWLGERYPELIQEIAAAGHEIASHGYSHSLIYQQTPVEFEADIKRSKAVLESIVSDPVVGYRAPSYSITRKTPWALDILNRSGFSYDSSIFPIYHDLGGLPNGNRFPYKIKAQAGEIVEVPLSTCTILGCNIPIAGGGYFRLYPYWITRKCIANLNKQGHPAVVYLHPWEFDPQQPKMPIDGLRKFRHYYGLNGTEKKLNMLLSDFRFEPMRNYIEANRSDLQFNKA